MRGFVLDFVDADRVFEDHAVRSLEVEESAHRRSGAGPGRTRSARVDRSKLKAVVANRNSPQKYVWRAKIVLLTADGRGTAEIMQTTGKAKTVIWRWQERFRDEGTAGLWRDKTRPSRIPPLSAEVAKRVVALTLAGPPPAASHWSGSAMAKAAGVSVSSVQRIWRAHGLQPHRVRQFKLSNDP
jgi:transposase